MKRIKIFDNDDKYYHDCKRIKNVMALHGYDISIQEAKILWEKYSDSMAAGWMCLDEDNETIFSNISSYFVEEENESK